VKKFSEILFSSEFLVSGISPTQPVQRIIADSSQIRPGDLFVAIKGTKVDSHQFLRDVAERGAVGAIVEDISQAPAGFPLAQVSSTRKIVGALASRLLDEPSQKFRLVGITGTNGKTTTTYLLEQVWKSLGLRTGLIGTIECRIVDEIKKSVLTTPGPIELQSLFAEMASKKVEAVAMEVTSIALDQFRVWGSSFEVAAFTNLTQDHLDYHGTFAEYFQAKVKLFTDYKIRASVVNWDDPWGKKLLALAQSEKRFSFSLEDPAADLCAKNIKYSAEGTSAELNTPQGVLKFQSPFIGAYNVSNCLAVLGIIHAQDLDLRQSCRALENALGAPGRLERVETSSTGPSVFVDYAHTPDALLKVLREVCRLKGKGRVLTVFGCGGDRDKTKRPVMGEIAAKASDFVILTSDNPRTEDPEKILDDIEVGVRATSTAYIREADRRKAIEIALSRSRNGDIVLVAGKGHETYQIVGVEQFSFDDKVVIRDYYNKSANS
jgi:UDP-N-acetylmuramoyl-L-alanyl-D-glutamate--2,6-diaminopimelate ligase